MKLIIGNMDKKTIDFIKKCKFTEKMLIINKMCNVKTIKEKVDVIIPYNIILNSGKISNTMVHLEELIITLEVAKIYYTNSYNHEQMKRLSSIYKVEVIHIDLNKETDKFIF